MKIKTVTITGADESVTAQDLKDLLKEFPFVEWAILISRASRGKKRFPSLKWIEGLLEANVQPLSLHLCGRYVNEILVGDIGFVATEIGTIWNGFKRVQINTHGEPTAFAPKSMVEGLKMWADKEFIFQYDNVNPGPVIEAKANGVNCSALFDLSHGAGVLPDKWPEPLNWIKCGYAGGLSPDNLRGELLKMKEVANKSEIWIDVETRVRSNNDQQFDLEKVRRFLTVSQEFVLSHDDDGNGRD